MIEEVKVLAVGTEILETSILAVDTSLSIKKAALSFVYDLISKGRDGPLLDGRVSSITTAIESGCVWGWKFFIVITLLPSTTADVSYNGLSLDISSRPDST